jgi:serine protease Do
LTVVTSGATVLPVQRAIPLLVAAAIVALAVPVRAGDPPAPPPDPYAASLARVCALEQQLVTTVETICQSSVSVVNKQIPKEVPGQAVSREPVIAGVGSGVIITRGGKSFILTNQHVIDHCDKLEVVTRDGVTRGVEVEDAVQQYDIALLRFTDKKTTGLKGTAVAGKKSEELDEGEWCIATGNPFFLALDGAPVVTLGVISGKDRVLGGNFTYGRAIQHDAAVNPGNSGGPLWNLKGEFVGINGMISAISTVAGQGPSNMGCSYSIPVEEIDVFLGQLIDAKKDARAGYLGIAAETCTDKAGKPVGARIAAIDPRSPAASGSKGLKVYDVIERLTIAGSANVIKTESDLINALSLCPAGARVTITYKRAGKQGVWSGELGAPQ